MIGFHFYRYLLPSSLVDDSRVESWLWFDERGERKLLLVCKEGYAIVKELAAFGAIVHTCSRNEAELNQRVQEWKSMGLKVSGSVCDLKVRAQQEKLMETVSSLFDGKLNILVNNAGISIPKEATEFTMEDFSTIITTNFESAYHLSQIAHPLLKASGNGNIIFISSVAGVIALPMCSIYASSKGAMNELTKNLACEWAKDKIRVNSVAPWMIRTPLLDNFEKDSTFLEQANRLILRTPIPRPREPNEVSSVVAFLCFPAASYVTGQLPRDENYSIQYGIRGTWTFLAVLVVLVLCLSLLFVPESLVPRNETDRQLALLQFKSMIIDDPLGA
ncbi:hypothetical protein KPL70_017740 [Citrus sinensis]|nr:hypothetical protein KPL70_017740 [Citrus sinensis]